MNKQEIFDKVVAHLGKQRAKSSSPSGDTCYYRGPNSTKCAVGCLIPDSDVDEDFMDCINDTNVHEEQIQNILKSVGIDIDDFGTLDLLEELQYVHDKRYVYDWSHYLINVASAFNLDFSSVHKAFE